MDVHPESATRAEAFQPIRLIEAEIARALPSVRAFDPETGKSYRRALALVRLHSQPLGLVSLQLNGDGLSPDDFARAIWASLGEKILDHLEQDGLPAVPGLEARGLARAEAPRCLGDRSAALARAPFVTIVVPTRDRPDDIRACLASLVTLEYPSYEILVVDNAPSGPETERVVMGIGKGDPRVRYVREELPGASWARNRGLREARGEIVAFTDDDATADRYWLVELVKGFYCAENVGCVTGNVLARRLETPAQAWFEERGGFSRGFTRRVYDMAEHRSSHPLYPYSAMMFGSGNSMAFRASVLRAIGGFDPALDPASPSRGGEDLAAFFEAVIRGYTLVYEPGAIVRHLHRPDYEGLRRQMYGWGVGFAAYLLRSLAAHPRQLPSFVRKLPYAIGVFLRGRVPYGLDQTRHLDTSFPTARTRDLRTAEYLGYLHGAAAYVRSVRHVRRLRKQFHASPAVAPDDVPSAGAELPMSLVVPDAKRD